MLIVDSSSNCIYQTDQTAPLGTHQSRVAVELDTCGSHHDTASRPHQLVASIVHVFMKRNTNNAQRVLEEQHH